MKISMAARRLNSTIKALISLPGTHPSFMVTAVQTKPESIFDTLITLHGWLCAGTSSQAGEVDLAMISQTALATKLRRADNQPLACVLTLHNTSDIYKVSISLIATRQQLAKVHQIDAPDDTGCHFAYFYSSWFIHTEYYCRLPKFFSQRFIILFDIG